MCLPESIHQIPGELSQAKLNDYDRLKIPDIHYRATLWQLAAWNCGKSFLAATEPQKKARTATQLKTWHAQLKVLHEDVNMHIDIAERLPAGPEKARLPGDV